MTSAGQISGIRNRKRGEVRADRRAFKAQLRTAIYDDERVPQTSPAEIADGTSQSVGYSGPSGRPMTSIGYALEQAMEATA